METMPQVIDSLASRAALHALWFSAVVTAIAWRTQVGICVAVAIVGIPTTLVTWAMKTRTLRQLPPGVDGPLPPSLSLEGVEAFLQARDEAVKPLKPGAHSSLTWGRAGKGRRAEYAVLYLHGWSASPREIHDVDLRVGARLGAHVLRFRLTAHGLAPSERGGRELLASQSLAVLQRDAATAYAIAKLCGRRVVVMGCSTGGTLGCWLAGGSIPGMCGPELAALVLISPAFELALHSSLIYHALKWSMTLLPRPIGMALLCMLKGSRYQDIQPNTDASIREAQSLLWTMRYPLAAVRTLFECYLMLELTTPPSSLRVPMLVFANPRDTIVSFHATSRYVHAVQAVGAAPAVLERVCDSENRHVITGILSPSTTHRVCALAGHFLDQHL